MKGLFFGFVMLASVASIGSSIAAAKIIMESAKPTGNSALSEKVILGHRIDSQGQFVLVTR